MAGTRRARRSCSTFPATVDADGKILAWRTEMWMPQTTKGLPNIPLLAPAAAGLDAAYGLSAPA